MPDKRSHRGPHPDDTKLFASETISSLRSALADFSLLLTKGYADKSALKLVGDRFSLTQRQRLAVMRSACSDQQLASRKQRCIDIQNLADKSVAIDGYNLLITIEAAMSGAIIFKGRDGCFRDLASIHGTYRKVEETIPAIELIGKYLDENNVAKVLWLLDSPVSNSGRLKKIFDELADRNKLNWEVKLFLNPDDELIKSDLIVVTSDSVILDKCKRWANIGAEIVGKNLMDIHIVCLS